MLTVPMAPDHLQLTRNCSPSFALDSTIRSLPYSSCRFANHSVHLNVAGHLVSGRRSYDFQRHQLTVPILGYSICKMKHLNIIYFVQHSKLYTVFIFKIPNIYLFAERCELELPFFKKCIDSLWLFLSGLK